MGRCFVRMMCTLVAVFLLCFSAKGQDNDHPSDDGSEASTSPDYDKLLDRAVEAFEAEEYVRARALFEQAYAIRPNARVLRGLGISALHLERFTVSKHELTEALEESKQPLTATQREGVKELLSWMQQNLGNLELHLKPANALVRLDDEAVTEEALVVKPGTHRLVVSADGYDAQERSVDVGAGQTSKVDVALAKQASDDVEAPAVAVTDVAMSAFMSGGNAGLRTTGDDFAPVRDRDSTPLVEQWWFWTVIGAVVVGGVATTVALTASNSKSYEKGGLGGVIMPLTVKP